MLCLVIGLMAKSLAAQSFEGSVTYKMTALNPMPDQISDSTWQAQLAEIFGPNGYMQQKYVYKGENYSSRIQAGAENGRQTFNPKDKFLYTWQEGSDEAIRQDTRKNADEFQGIEKLTISETILGHKCNVIKVKSAMGEMIVYYNSSVMKVNPALYKGHIFGHWEQILNEIKCIPLKIEQKGMFVHVVQTAVEYKAEKIDDKEFIIPEFSVITDAEEDLPMLDDEY